MEYLTPLASSTPFTSHTAPRPIILTPDHRASLYSDSLNPVLNNKASNSVQSHRQRIVKEIFDTEHTYISQLNTVITLFLRPLRVRGLLPHDVIADIFSNIEAILSVNRELFACMRQRSLGEAFTYLGPFLKLYSTYANNFQNATSVLQDQLRNNHEFSSFISVQEVRPECCGLRLSSLLITPIQRIPRYKLLLDDLLKHTRLTHADYSKLNTAAAQIEAIASHINDYIRQHENFNKMLSIQNVLTGQTVPGILAPARKFIHEGRLMKICYRKAKERMVFLFSDILIYAKPRFIKSRDQSRRYECRCVLPLLNSSVEVIDKDHRAPGITALLKISNNDTSLLFYSEHVQEVLNWTKIIQETIRALQTAFSSLVTAQVDEAPDRSQESSPVCSTSATLDMGTLTPRTPYPLTATLFSTFNFEQAKTTSIRKNIVHEYDTQSRILEDQDSTESEREKMIPDQSERTHQLPQSSRCCTIS